VEEDCLGMAKPCEWCTQSGLKTPRLAVDGERYCHPCRAIVLKKMTDDGYLSKDHGDGRGQASEADGWEETYAGHQHKSNQTGAWKPGSSAVDVEDDAVEAVEVLAKGTLKCSDNGLGFAAKIKQAIHQNRLVQRFRSGKDKPNEYRKHPLFVSLARQFKPKPIKSDEEYLATMRRALEVDVANRAVNCAYLLILDGHLKQYEEKNGPRCELLYDQVTNEMLDQSERNQEE
jgi:hypothetical protein